ACKVRFPIAIDLQSSSIPIEQRASVAIRLETLLNVHGDASPYHYKVSPAADRSVPLTVILQLETDDGGSGLHYTLDSWSPTVTVTRGAVTPGDDDLLASQLHQLMQQIMVDEHASIALLLRDSPLHANFRDGSAFASEFESLQRRTTRAFKPAPSYHLTISLFSGGSAPSSWDIKTATEQYISPLLGALSSISNFTVDTQVQLHASISPAIAGPTFESATNTWTLLATDLSGFVNAAEWPLSPGIGSGSTINLILYIPHPRQMPLILYGGGNSWIVPQWGGVQIVNPPSNTTSHLSAADLESVMLTFADQLMSLLGVPDSPSSLALRIASLQRQRTISLVLSASSTLGALVRLTRKLQSIAIPKTVAHSVDLTISHLEQACTALSEGDYIAALSSAKVAEAEAEKAFFEPSMVGQVYFPEEHKFAVYVPLLGPMGVPLVMTLIKEVKGLVGRRKEKVKVG
ncbi:GPI transamidase component, partial [Oleoguttula sp. CCFEE 5521]